MSKVLTSDLVRQLPPCFHQAIKQGLNRLATGFRMAEFFEGDAQTYRGPGELDDIRANHDCLKKFAAQVTAAGVISADELAPIDREALAVVEDAVARAKAAPLPTAADLTTDVYVSY